MTDTTLDAKLANALHYALDGIQRALGTLPLVHDDEPQHEARRTQLRVALEYAKLGLLSTVDDAPIWPITRTKRPVGRPKGRQDAPGSPIDLVVKLQDVPLPIE